MPPLDGARNRTVRDLQAQLQHRLSVGAFPAAHPPFQGQSQALPLGAHGSVCTCRASHPGQVSMLPPPAPLTPQPAPGRQRQGQAPSPPRLRGSPGAGHAARAVRRTGQQIRGPRRAPRADASALHQSFLALPPTPRVLVSAALVVFPLRLACSFSFLPPLSPHPATPPVLLSVWSWGSKLSALQ